jgi:hypothetical protein
MASTLLGGTLGRRLALTALLLLLSADRPALGNPGRSVRISPAEQAFIRETVTNVMNNYVLPGASLALAGMTACTRQPNEHIMPYVRQPEELIPGKPLFFATAYPTRRKPVAEKVDSFHAGINEATLHNFVRSVLRENDFCRLDSPSRVFRMKRCTAWMLSPEPCCATRHCCCSMRPLAAWTTNRSV